MSLFNNVTQSLQKTGLMGAVNSGIGGLLGKASSGLAGALGGGALASTVAGMGEVMVGSAVQGAINEHVPPVVRNALNVAGGAVGDAMGGNWAGAGLRVLDSSVIDSLFPDNGGARSQSRYWSTPTPLFGGITPKEAKAIYEASRAESKAKKNLWLVEVVSGVGGAERFNLFATEVEYAPHNIAGDKRRVGAATVDAVTGGEAVELRITTMDDAAGSLKRWFAAHAALVEHPDGTVGVPSEYKIGIRIIHGVVSSKQRVAYEDKGLFRPVGVEYSLSRREDALQELQMTFTQLDTFMR